MAVSVFFASCETEDEQVTEEQIIEEEVTEEEATPVVALAEEDITGIWQVTGYLVEDGKSTTVSYGESTTVDYTATGKDYDMTLTFSDDPKTITSEGSYTIVVTSMLLGQENTQEEEVYTALDSSEWDIDAEKLILFDEYREDYVTLTELTETKMVMVMDVNEEITIDANSTVFTTAVLTLTLEK